MSHTAPSGLSMYLQTPLAADAHTLVTTDQYSQFRIYGHGSDSGGRVLPFPEGFRFNECMDLFLLGGGQRLVTLSMNSGMTVEEEARGEHMRVHVFDLEALEEVKEAREDLAKMVSASYIRKFVKVSELKTLQEDTIYH